MASTTTNVSFRIDTDVKNQADTLFSQLGLNMTTAFSVFIDPVSNDWTREFLNAVPDHYPGTLFGYDTSGTHTLCEIVQKYCRQDMRIGRI